MALGDPYATLAQLKSYLQVSDAVDDGELTGALTSSSREIEKHCNRQFNKATSATARIYYPDSACLAYVDDFWTTSGLVVKTDDGDDGTFETTWATTDFQLEPLNAVVDGESGWAYWRIRAIYSRCFPITSRRAPLQVTAQWGWAAVPAPVQQACLILSAEVFKLRSAPFGVAGFGEYGAIRVRENPKVCALLKPYERNRILVG
ncbi:head-tail connector protein [Nonomuraea typhae]|uniref:head-tail connector protein n=1 Tax=Nonomuraea typhae TaxID=2603600 RepID=UPI0012FCAD8D|nr:head-tail connector protein [Nonomuraea typhae]